MTTAEAPRYDGGCDEPALVDAILALVRSHTDTDFSRYRRSTVQRRIANRMSAVGAVTLEGYLATLTASPSEVTALAERLTIKVSSFYRDRRAFDAVRAHAIPALAAARAGARLRLWSAACGYGEEAHTLAMLLAERDLAGTVHATDIDRAALAGCEAAIYAPESVMHLPAELASAYLELRADGASYAVRASVSARVRALRHDLMSETPPAAAPFDLISCRNVLIYMQPEAQRRVLERLLAVLAPGGYLFLGEAEWPSGLEDRLQRDPSGAHLFRLTQ